MKAVRFQNRVAMSSATLPIATVISVLLWCAHGFFEMKLLYGALSCGLITYLWTEINNTNSLIRIRSFLTSSVYVFLCGCLFGLHSFSEGHVISALVLLSYGLLFKSYSSAGSVLNFFHAFLCLGLASLLFPKVLLFVPIYLWYAFVYLRSLSLRTFSAAIVGLLLPYWLVGCYSLYKGENLFIGYVDELITFHPISIAVYADWILTDLLGFILVSVFSIISGIHCLRSGFNDKVRTRMLLYLLLTQEFIIGLFVLLQPNLLNVLFPILVMNTSPILAHFFALTHHKVTNVLFVLFVMLFIALAILSIWMS
ncbi:MAG: hypothetical protein J6J76_02070 [Paraprevotella sp.]|nr:hypothetical protein [Paraprevotella sp.]